MTGAANLMFLFIVISGLFLWWPKTWAALRQVVWFRKGLSSKARDFNWHNTIGFWSAIPLVIIVAGGVVISYPWATALVYRAYGEQPPAPPARAQQEDRSGTERSERREGARQEPGMPLEFFVTRAQRQVPDWRSITLALAPSRTTTLTIDSGDGGQPQKRATLTVERRGGDTVRWEPFVSQSAGRRARTWLRFAHTGEVYGLAGQTVAGVVTGGAVVLVWTGLALALRRFFAWRKRTAVQRGVAEGYIPRDLAS